MLRVRMFGIGLLAALVACAQPMSHPDCTAHRFSVPLEDWSVPSLINASRPGRTLRWPSVAVVGDTFYVAANVFPAEPTTTLDQRPLSVLRVPGGRIATPQGQFLFAFPKGVVDSRGIYHLIWGEPDTLIADVRHWPGGPLKSVWYAAYDGRTWSSPEKLFETSRILLGAENGVIASDAHNGLHLILPTIGSDSRPTLTYVRRTGTAWEVRKFATGAAYASILAWGSDSIAIAYTAPDTTLSEDGNSVFVKSSGNRGAVWSEPQLISTSVARDATSPLLSRTGGRIHLVWGRRSSAFSLAALVARELRDGGMWSPMSEAPLPRGGLRFHVGETGGSVTAIVEEFDGHRLTLREVTWRGGNAYSTPLFADLRHAASAGFAASPQTSFLLWSGSRAEGEVGSTFSSVRRSGISNRCSFASP